MTAPLPCPFCGKRELRTVTAGNEIGYGEAHPRYALRCLSCYAQGPWKHTRILAVEVWSVRK